MINIDLKLDDNHCIIECESFGHANADKNGFDIVCASVSILLRTFAQVLFGKNGIKIHSEAETEGSLWIKLEYEANGKDFLFACGNYLMTGLLSVEKEFPNNVKLSFNN
jgi:uncharacterized protein YsxB (DUF464 family)